MVVSPRRECTGREERRRRRRRRDGSGREGGEKGCRVLGTWGDRWGVHKLDVSDWRASGGERRKHV